MKNKSIRLIISISLNAIAILFVIYVVYSVGNQAFSFGAKVFNEQAVDTDSQAREVQVTIPEKVTVKELAGILYGKGLIEDRNVFYVQVLLSDYKDKFIPGTYTLKTSMKPTEIMENLCTEASTDGE